MDPSEPSPAATGRYWAFISYSHRDERQTARLHRQLESYPIPKRLVEAATSQGQTIPKRLFPVFRDRDELGGAPDLSARIQDALRDSRFLIVVCSPHSVGSRWVDEEIKAFKRLGRESRVLAYIVDGEPNASDDPRTTSLECFPEGLRFRMGLDGVITSERTEPIAADARKGKDGDRLALLKLVSGILDVRFDDLRRRDEERLARRRRWIVGTSLTAVALFAGLAGYADWQRTVANERSRVALSRQLAVQALNELPSESAGARQSDYARGLLLAAQALDVKPTVEARSVLLKAVLVSPHRLKHLWGHSAPVTAAAFARPDGKTFATVGGDGAVILWDGVTHQPLEPRVSGHKVRSLAFGRGGAVLATGGEDGTVMMWDVTTRRQLAPPLVAREPVLSLAFSPDGTRLAAGGGRDAGTGELFVWDLANPTAPRTPAESQKPHPPVRALAFSTDGTILLSASSDGAMVQWDAATLTRKRQWPGQRFKSATFHADGTRMAAGGHSGVGTRLSVRHPFGLIVWDLASGEPQSTATPDEIEDVRSVAFGPDGVLAAGTPDGRVRLWNVDDAKARLVETLLGHKAEVTSLAFAPDGASLLSGAADGTVILRDLRSRDPLVRTLGHPSTEQRAEQNPFYRLDGIALTSDGKTMASEGVKGKVVLWDVASGTPRRELTGNGAATESLAFTADDRSLFAATKDGMMVWDVAGDRLEGMPAGPRETAEHHAVTRDGKIVALATADNSVRLWDVAGRREIGAPLRGHQAKVTDLAFSHDGKSLASGSADGVVMLWNVDNQQPLTSPMRHDAGGIDILSFHQDGTTLAVAASRAEGSTITLWNVRAGERADFVTPPGPLLWDTSPVRMVFSPNGALLIVAFRSGEIRLWDVAHRRPLAESLRGHADFVVAFGFSEDGQTLFSADLAGTAMGWDLAKRLPVSRVAVRSIRAAVFSSDARVMAATAAWGPRLLLVDWDATSWSRYACAAANRMLSRNEWEQFVSADVEYAAACGPSAQAGRPARLWDWRPAFWGRQSRANQ